MIRTFPKAAVPVPINDNTIDSILNLINLGTLYFRHFSAVTDQRPRGNILNFTLDNNYELNPFYQNERNR
jgi:hypothetical protein